MIAALDWGTGHATRCVPLIRELQKNNQIILGITASTESIFREEFSDLATITLPSYSISYSSTLPLWMKLAAQFFRIRSVIRKENALLNQLITKHKIDVIISDNRFGLYSNQAYTVFITHQVFLRTPFASAFLQRINKKYIERFNELWIPDHENVNSSLSGSLSHGDHFHKNVKYIGPLSRLHPISTGKKFDYLFLLSGPEPQHTLLAQLLLKKAKEFPEKKIALCSHSFHDKINSISNLVIYTSPNLPTLSELILASETIICRSGYSTLMDLDHLGKLKMILIPTPGQTEQEYLAEFWKEKRGAVVCEQKEIEELKLT